MQRNRAKEGYNIRKKRVRDTLIEWGIPGKLIRKIINPLHKLGDLEKIVHATGKRNPQDPAEHFLKGLNYYRQKHAKPSLYRSLTNKKGADRKWKL